MGLGYLGAMLKNIDCDVDVLDIRLHRHNKSFIVDYLKANQGKYDLFGISGMVTTFQYSAWIAQEIRKHNPKALILAGGSIHTAGELLLKNSDIDAVCIGEGEKVIVDIVSVLRSTTSITKVPNILTKHDGNIIFTGFESPMDINAIPRPAWELFDMKQYTTNPYLVPVKTPSITMITERGCPFECVFCYRNFGRQIRHRNVDRVIEEIKMSIDRYGVGHIDFLDEVFNINPSYIKDLCNAIIREGIKITWRCIGRTDLVDKDILQHMYAAGCRWIGYGIESGSPAMLNRMNKKQKIDLIEKSLELSREAGLIVTGTFIVGMPGETEQTVQESANFFERNKIFNIPFFPVPYPGTILYEDCRKKGLIKDEKTFIESLEKDATELVINLTSLPNDRLIKLKEDLVEKYKCFIPNLELPTY